MMRKKLTKKAVLREGYLKGLKHAQKIINGMIAESAGSTTLDERLCEMCIDGTAQEVEQLIDQGANVVGNGYKWSTPLCNAARNKYDGAAIIKLLVKYGADTEEVNDNTYYTPLATAASCNNVAAIKALLRAGADLSNNASGGARTALHVACYHNNAQAAAALIKAGADAYALNEDGMTPFGDAVNPFNSKAKFPMIKMLLDSGIDLLYPDDEAMRYLIQSGDDSVYEKLRDYVAQKSREESRNNPEWDEYFREMKKWRRTTDFDDPNRPAPPQEPASKYDALRTYLNLN